MDGQTSSGCGPSDPVALEASGVGRGFRQFEDWETNSERGELGLSDVSRPGDQHGGSSSSHGMQAVSLSERYYEDYYGDEMLMDRFPYVGSWLQRHFLLHLFSLVGEQVLWALGERSLEWFILRRVSGGVRCAVTLAVADVLRRGPFTILYSGPQGLAAVDEFIRRGEHVEDSVVGFPYVEGPPGMVAHYLWRVFMLVGWCVLDFLGDRVCSWGCLRGVAQGFRSSATLA